MFFEFFKVNKKMISLKRLIMFFCTILAISLLCCSPGTSSESFNYYSDTPAWLKAKIDSISVSTEHYYGWTKVFRYNMNETFVYLFSIPLSSCKYCELYGQDGNKLTAFNDSALQSVLNQKTGEVLIWENKK